MGKRYVCKECSGEVTLSHYSLPKDGLCPSCRDAAREVKKALIEEQKNFKTCIRCDNVFDKREAENPRAHTCPTCLEVEALEKQKKKEAYEFFNHKRRTLWARTFIMRVHETVSDYESCERSQEQWSREEFIGLMVKESHSDTRRYDSRTTLPFMSMESRNVSSAERTYDHINGMVSTIQTLAAFIDEGRIKTEDEALAFLDQYSCMIQVSKALNVNELKEAQNAGHITPEQYYTISGGMWHKKEKREVSLEEFVEAAGKHFISNIGA
jgi:hypothetical protein